MQLQPTYYRQGFFNVTVDFDRYVGKDEGPVDITVGQPTRGVIRARIDRHSNPNGTARIMGGVKLRDWFQSMCAPMDYVDVDRSSQDHIHISKLNQETMGDGE